MIKSSMIIKLDMVPDYEWIKTTLIKDGPYAGLMVEIAIYTLIYPRSGRFSPTSILKT